MTHQLRALDMLARLGGNEFAILLHQVRNRTEVEEISLHLEHCAKAFCRSHGFKLDSLNSSAPVGFLPATVTTD
jgi:GGDEF domain-containing protein